MTRIKLAALSLIGLLVLLVAGLLVVYLTQRHTRPPATDEATAITISASACTPDSVSVPAGVSRFTIHNASQRAIEWEILRGVIVVAERENIAPGFTVTLAPRLEPGVYQMTCGLLSNPKGRLTVTAPDGGTIAAPKAPMMTDLIGPTAEYRVYAVKSTNAVTKAAASLSEAIKAGDLTTAKTHYGEARTAFFHITPISEQLGESAIKVETSLSRLGVALTSTDRLQTAATEATALSADARALGQKARAVTAPPQAIVSGATRLLLDMVKAGVPPEAAPVAIAKLEGIGKIIALFAPLTTRADKALAIKIAADLEMVNATLAPLSEVGATPGAADKTLLHDRLSDLAADFIDLSAALALNGPEGK